jgi:hypothetical protein
MATLKGRISVYESSDGGSGDPRRTTWQFFVGEQAVSTLNPDHAKTIQLALQKNSEVQVTVDNAQRVTQVRIQF